MWSLSLPIKERRERFWIVHYSWTNITANKRCEFFPIPPEQISQQIQGVSCSSTTQHLPPKKNSRFHLPVPLDITIIWLNFLQHHTLKHHTEMFEVGLSCGPCASAWEQLSVKKTNQTPWPALNLGQNPAPIVGWTCARHSPQLPASRLWKSQVLATQHD